MIGRFTSRHHRIAGAVAGVAGSLLAASFLVGAPGAAGGSAAATSCSGVTPRVHSGSLIAMPMWSNKACPSGFAAKNTSSGELGAAAAHEPAYIGAPPLTFHGGDVMGTPSVGSHIVITPIYWSAGGASFDPSYESIINQYLTDIAADSGKTTNVYSTIPQYTGANGTFTYNFSTGTPIVDTSTPYGTECTPDGGAVYSDNSGYNSCVDDHEIIQEVRALTTALHLPWDLGHIYPVFLPKGVESCFFKDGNKHQACTINASPTGAYCAYHSTFNRDYAHMGVYAAMPFPVLDSPVGFTCGLDPLPTIHGNVDADAEVSPLSHELAESFSDENGLEWNDRVGFENGDDCAYIYGPTLGTKGNRYNQVINGDHWLSQEEFSNANFVPHVSGCVQHMAPLPVVTTVSPHNGLPAGGQTVTITGTNFTNVVAVDFGKTKAASYTVDSATQITAVSPAHAPGTVSVNVTTDGGTSAPVAGSDYLFVAS